MFCAYEKDGSTIEISLLGVEYQCCFYLQLKPLKQWQTLLVLLLYACILCQSLPQLRPSQRLSFTNLRDFITQLKTSSTLSRESLDNIKTNIQNIGKIEQPPPEVTTPPTRRPPYMFQGQKLFFYSLTANVFLKWTNANPMKNFSRAPTACKL